MIKIKRPIQVSIALSWILLGIAWLVKSQLLLAVMLIGAGSFMIFDGLEK